MLTGLVWSLLKCFEIQDKEEITLKSSVKKKKNTQSYLRIALKEMQEVNLWIDEDDVASQLYTKIDGLNSIVVLQ